MNFVYTLISIHFTFALMCNIYEFVQMCFSFITSGTTQIDRNIQRGNGRESASELCQYKRLAVVVAKYIYMKSTGCHELFIKINNEVRVEKRLTESQPVFI